MISADDPAPCGLNGGRTISHKKMQGTWPCARSWRKGLPPRLASRDRCLLWTAKENHEGTKKGNRPRATQGYLGQNYTKFVKS